MLYARTGMGTRLGLLGLLWATLVEGHPRGLFVGLVVLPLVAWGSVVLAPSGAWRLSPPRLLGLVGVCAWRLVRAGGDVALRAWSPRWSECPGLLEVPSRLPRGPARSLLVGLVSLVPDLHAVEVRGAHARADRLTLHVADARPEALAAALARVRDLERRVARVFHLPAPLRGLP
jgi:multicomponent Na+:H+ antiporter subunit E